MSESDWVRVEEGRREGEGVGKKESSISYLPSRNKDGSDNICSMGIEPSDRSSHGRSD